VKLSKEELKEGVLFPFAVERIINDEKEREIEEGVLVPLTKEELKERGLVPFKVERIINDEIDCSVGLYIHNDKRVELCMKFIDDFLTKDKDGGKMIICMGDEGMILEKDSKDSKKIKVDTFTPNWI